MITPNTYGIILVLFSFSMATFCYGNEGKPVRVIHFTKFSGSTLASDSVPIIKKSIEMKKDSSSREAGIKEVPKSKKQAAPTAISVSTTVQPIKIIKPKIIKPVIKIK
jgi:hypothetical protein